MLGFFYKPYLLLWRVLPPFFCTSYPSHERVKTVSTLISTLVSTHRRATDALRRRALAHRGTHIPYFQTSIIMHRSAVVIIVSFLRDTYCLNLFLTGRESHNWLWSICSPACVLTLTSDFNELVLQWLELLAMGRSERERATLTTQRRPGMDVCIVHVPARAWQP